jgi:hypothetical protein
MVLEQAGASSALHAMDYDTDFQANSRRVRLEALANHIRTAQRFLQTGAFESKKQLVRGLKLTVLTSIMPDLEPIIQGRWLEAQRCQIAGAYVSAVIMMGSILEALLLARCSSDPQAATVRARHLETNPGRMSPCTTGR